MVRDFTEYLQIGNIKNLSIKLIFEAIVLKHALRNALIPIITIAGSQLGDILTGSIIIE